MANKLKKSFLDYFNINRSDDDFEDDLFDEDVEDEDDDYFDFEDDYEAAPVKKNTKPAKEPAATFQSRKNTAYTKPQPSEQQYVQPAPKKQPKSQPSYGKNNSKVVPINSTKAERNTYNPTPGSDIYSIQPARFDDGQIIVNHLIDNDVVLCNLEGLDQYDAQRIIDFISGACCALDAGIRKLSEYVYVIAPSGVYLTGDFKDGYDGASAANTQYGAGANYQTATYTDSAFGAGSYY